MPCRALSLATPWRRAPPPWQVAGTGTGIRRHRLFFLGFKNKEGGSSTARRSWRWPWRRATQPAGEQGLAHGLLPAQAAVGAGAQAAADAQQPGGTEALDDAAWMDDYYGSLGSTAQPSPGLAGLGRPQGSSAPAARKASSVFLSVAAEPGTPRSVSGRRSSGEASGGEAAEGADVAAERARVEALWQQWCAGFAALNGRLSCWHGLLFCASTGLFQLPLLDPAGSATRSMRRRQPSCCDRCARCSPPAMATPTR